MKTSVLLLTLCSAGAALAVAQPATKPKTANAAAPAPPAPAAPVPATSPEAKSAPAATAQPQAGSAASPAPAPSPAAPEQEESIHSTLITSDLGGRDLRFLTDAIEHGKTQLYLGELARTKATSDQVKAVGEALASTQAEENRKLVRLGAMKGVNLSADEPHGKKALEARLAKLSGPKLEKTILEEIVAVNTRAVATYEAAVETQDDDIKAFVDQGLPLAEEKLRLAGKMTGMAPRPPKAPAPEAPAAEAQKQE